MADRRAAADGVRRQADGLDAERQRVLRRGAVLDNFCPGLQPDGVRHFVEQLEGAESADGGVA